MTEAPVANTTDNPELIIASLINRGRTAMSTFEHADQARVDEAVTALAWAIYEPTRAKELAEMAVIDTGLGDVESKIIKNTRKTFGTLRDLIRARARSRLNR